MNIKYAVDCTLIWLMVIFIGIGLGYIVLGWATLIN